MTPRNVLAIKLRYLGDVLLATPALHALKAAYPTARLSVLVNRGTDAVLRGNEDVDEIIPLDRGSLYEQTRFVWQMRRRRFDTVVESSSLGPPPSAPTARPWPAAPTSRPSDASR